MNYVSVKALAIALFVSFGLNAQCPVSNNNEFLAALNKMGITREASNKCAKDAGSVSKVEAVLRSLDSSEEVVIEELVAESVPLTTGCPFSDNNELLAVLLNKGISLETMDKCFKNNDCTSEIAAIFNDLSESEIVSTEVPVDTQDLAPEERSLEELLN